MKRNTFFVLILSLMPILNCTRDKNPLVPESGPFIYPVRTGNQWEYRRSLFFRPLSDETSMAADTVFTESIIKVNPPVMLPGSIQTFPFEERINDNGRLFTSESYYANSQKGLYLYAYRYAQGGTLIPKKKAGQKIFFKDQIFDDMSEIALYLTQSIPFQHIMSDSIIYENPPLLALKYPLTINQKWTYRKPGHPWHIEKEIVAEEEIKVPAGSFVCFKIQWLMDIKNDLVRDDDIVFYDYVCEKGLIKRYILIKNVKQVDEQGETSLIDTTDEAVLIKVTLK